MRFTLEKIDASTPLAELFNAYLAGLSTLSMCYTPRESMRDCRVAFAAEAKGAMPEFSIATRAQYYYELIVLSNSLNSLHWCVEQALELLSSFYTEHGGDLIAYAVANRREVLTGCGGGEDADWQWNGVGDPKAGEGWEITETTDPARLDSYSLHQELAQYFTTDDTAGEAIGSSGPIDFHRYTLAVAHQTDFAPRKMFAAVGWSELTTYRQDEDGQLAPIPIADQIEREINEDIANERLIDRFVAVLDLGLEAAKLYTSLDPKSEGDYYQLFGLLTRILHG